MKNNRTYGHLTQSKRDRLQVLLDDGVRQKDIAKVLGVDPSTISREIKRNRRKIRQKGGTRDGPYVSEVANHKAYVSRKYAKFEWKKINESDQLREYIVRGLRKYWNPDEISGRMKKDKEPFYASKTAIYEWLRSDRGKQYCIYLLTQRTKVKKRKDKPKMEMIPDRISIRERPKEADTEYGNYELDTAVSGKKSGGKAALSVAYERKAKHLDVKKLKDMSPGGNAEAIKKMLETREVSSLTYDNGLENRKWQSVGIPSYFCDPHAPWQKGGVENAIKMIRRFIVKGSNIGMYSDGYVKMVVDILNNKPRKSLGYKTADEVMRENTLIKNESKISIGEIALRG